MQKKNILIIKNWTENIMALKSRELNTLTYVNKIKVLRFYEPYLEKLKTEVGVEVYNETKFIVDLFATQNPLAIVDLASNMFLEGNPDAALISGLF